MILRGRKIRSDAVVQECERFKTEIVSRDSFAAGCTATVPYQTSSEAPLSSRVGTEFTRAATGTLPVTLVSLVRMNQMQVAIIESRGKIRMFGELERETARGIFGGGLRGTLLE